jgi:peptidoglycan hydrolase CwlO-like protein
MSRIESRSHVSNEIQHNATKINAVDERVTKLEAKIKELEDIIERLKPRD